MPKNDRPMYFVTTMDHPHYGNPGAVGKSNLPRTHTVGFFTSEKNARQIFKGGDPYDLFEAGNEWAVVERILPGIYPIHLPACTVVTWYRYDRKKKKWNETEAPEGAKSTCNFSIG